MFDIGWTELMVIGVVALVVIGPKDLPEMFKTMGRFTAKARSMAREFQRAMETAANETGVKDVAKDLRAITSPSSMGLDAVKNAASKFEKWDPLKPAVTKPAATSPVAIPDPAAPAPAAASAPTPVAVAPMGPATQALADQVAAKKAIALEAAEKMRAVSATPPAATASGNVIRAPRLRKPKVGSEPDPASVSVPASGPTKPAPKPRAKKPSLKDSA